MSDRQSEFILETTAVTFGIIPVRAWVLSKFLGDKVDTIYGDPVDFIVVEKFGVEFYQPDLERLDLLPYVFDFAAYMVFPVTPSSRKDVLRIVCAQQGATYESTCGE